MKWLVSCNHRKSVAINTCKKISWSTMRPKNQIKHSNEENINRSKSREMIYETFYEHIKLNLLCEKNIYGTII